MIVRSSASPLAGIPLPVTGCGWCIRTINFCFFFETLQSRKTNATNATHASNPYAVRLSGCGVCPSKRHTCHPKRHTQTQNATQTPPAPMGGTTAIALHRLEEEGIPVAIHRHDCPSSVLPTAGQLPTGWIPPPANTSGGWNCWRLSRGCWAKTGRRRYGESVAGDAKARGELFAVDNTHLVPHPRLASPLRARWIPPHHLTVADLGLRLTLVGSEHCYPLQTSSRWSPRWWGRGSLPNCTPSS